MLQLNIIFKQKSLIWEFAKIDLKSRYRNSTLGVLWSFLEPLFILTILNFVFSNLLITKVENFPIFLILNLVLFNYFVRATTASSESLLSRANIIKMLFINREIFPVAANLTALSMMAIEFSIVIVFVVIYQFIPSATILIIPLLIVLLICLTNGLSMILSVINVRYRDTRVIWGVITTGLFFLTPIFYRIDFLPTPIADIVRLNPLALILEMTHNAFLFDTLPNWNDLVYVMVSSIAVLVIGWLIFKKLNPGIVEKI